MDPPLPVLRAARRHRRRLLAGRSGPTLDLGGPLRADVVPGEVELVEEATPLSHALAARVEVGRSYETVVSAFALTLARDLEVALALVPRVLSPSGRLVFVEADARPTILGRVGRSLVRSVAGAPVGRDVSGAMWAAGLTIVDVERFTVSTLAVPYRHLMAGDARRTRTATDTEVAR